MFKVFRKKKKEKEAAAKTPAPAPAEKKKEKASSPKETAKAKTNGSKKKDKPKSKPALSPEEMCGIKSSMPKDKIREELAKLFRRHNRAAASLDEKLRSEAEVMLDAIVTVRERYLS